MLDWRRSIRSAGELSPAVVGDGTVLDEAHGSLLVLPSHMHVDVLHFDVLHSREDKFHSLADVEHALGEQMTAVVRQVRQFVGASACPPRRCPIGPRP